MSGVPEAVLEAAADAMYIPRHRPDVSTRDLARCALEAALPALGDYIEAEMQPTVDLLKDTIALRKQWEEELQTDAVARAATRAYRRNSSRPPTRQGVEAAIRGALEAIRTEEEQ